MLASNGGARRARWAGVMASLLAGLLVQGSVFAQNLKPGDLMFTAYNTQQDGWALVALVDLAPGTTVYFSDNAWRSGSFAPGKGFERWTSGAAPIAAGTVVRFSFIDDAQALKASVGDLSRAVVPGSAYLNLSQTSGTLYAYQGNDPTLPSVFLTAISNGAFGSTAGALAGTGLAAGSNALLVPQSTQYAEYTATRTSTLSADGYRSLLASASNWSALNGGSYAAQVANAAPLAVVSVPEPTGPWLLLTGALTLGIAGRRWRAAHAPSNLGVRVLTDYVLRSPTRGPGHARCADSHAEGRP